MPSFGVDFGPKVDLTATIRGILRNYPEGTAVLKELVQNADDAGAHTLPCDELVAFQGPALLVYNDATFTRTDFESIQRIGDSLKKAEETQSKIGRFGIGFNSVYHMTDLPSFVSTQYIVLLDPQARFLPDVNPSNPGKMIDFLANPEVVQQYSDQFAPYEVYGVDWTKSFDGTLFRLPLRTSEQAETSQLSRRALSAEEIKDLLLALQLEASAMLLFLKNIERIEIKLLSSTSEKEGSLVYSCSIDDMTAELRAQRSFVASSLKLAHENRATGKATPEQTLTPKTADYTLRIRCIDMHPTQAAAGIESCYIETWDVCNQLGGGSSTQIARDPANSLLRLVPWGGVAALVSTTRVVVAGQRQLAQSGLAYCFLPLPVSTGLPVMVNAFFELSSNRRDIWQAGQDMQGDGRTRALWNVSLLRDVISPSYVRLLLRQRHVMGFSEQFQSLWPSATLAAPWNNVYEATLNACKNERLVKRAMRDNDDSVVEVSAGAETKVQTKSRKSMFGFGKSGSSGGDVKITGSSNSSDPAWMKPWIECHQAVLLPEEDSSLQPADMHILVDVLLQTNQPVVVCEPMLRNILTISKVCETVALPSFIRYTIRHDCSRSDQTQYIPPQYYCRFLLSYCLLDSSMKNPNPTLELDSLPLLPLADESVGLLQIMTEKQRSAISELTGMGFSMTQAKFALSRVDFDVIRACEFLTSCDSSDNVGGQDTSSAIYVVCEESEMKVFQLASDILLDKTLINTREVEFLTHKNMQLLSNVRPFAASLVPDLLRRILPTDCFTGQQAVLSSLIGHETISSFLTDFWNFMKDHPDVMSAVVEGAAVVPTRDGLLLPLSRMSHCIAHQRAEAKVPVEIISILEALGAHVVDESVITQVSAAMPHLFWDYVHSPVRQGVLALLDLLLRSSRKGNTDSSLPGEDIFDCLNMDQRDRLLSYIAESEQISTLSDKELQVIRQLPLFKVANGSYYVRLSKFSKDSPSTYVAIKDKSKLTPELFPSHILSYDTPQVLQLYQLTGVTVISRSNYFKTMLLPNANDLYNHLPNEVEQDMFTMLIGITTLLDEDRNFGQVLRDFSFVPNGVPLVLEKPTKETGSDIVSDREGCRRLYKPSELFDPDVDELDKLLDPSYFPAVEFQREDVLAHLRTVGLHSSLDWTGVIACAKSIEAMPVLPPPDIVPPCDENSAVKEMMLDEKLNFSPRQERGACLFQYLSKNLGRLVGENSSNTKKRSSMFSLRGLFSSDISEKVDTSTIDENINILLRIAWVPVHTATLDKFMPWNSEFEGAVLPDVAAPLHCRPSSDAWWCSASRRIAVMPSQVAIMSKTFTWDSLLPIEVIATQLREIAVKYEAMKMQVEVGQNQGSGLNNTQLVTAENMQQSRERLSALIPVLYQRLNGVDAHNTSAQQKIVTILRSYPWIWVGDRFVHPTKVAFTSTLSLTPYLYAIPQDLAVYSTLLNLFEVKESFTARDYVAVLHQMAVETNSIAPIDESEAITQQTLPESLIDMAVSLVTLLSAEGGGGGGEGSFRALDHTIYAPDHLGKLEEATCLVADDVPWMNGAAHASTRAGIRLCHPHISSKVAYRIGVKSLRQMLVDRSVDTLFVEDDNSMHPSKGFVEAFGPSESLTGRLRTILDMYPDGNPIFSELIQNADDAGATVVRIMIDENTYKSESLMDPSVSALQGPALLFYNDATFSESDFRSLARIGQGSKLEKLSTTGRFGLGFNSVYHLTDTPSFVSGEHLVVFDPHTNFIPGTTPSQPGLRMKYCGNNLSNTFPDQFRPYEYFGCDFKKSYAGTLFRFPFRNNSMARKSEISKRSYSVTDVNVLLEQLSAELPQYLIFLRSVCTIEIYRLEENSTEPVLLQRAQSTISNASQYNDQSLLQYFEKVSPQSSQENTPAPQALSKDNFYAHLSSTPDNRLPTRVFHLTVNTTSTVSCKVSSTIPHPAIVDETKGDTFSDSHGCSSVEYLVVMGLRGGSAKELACNPKMRHLKLVPMGALAACIRRDSVVTDEAMLIPTGGFPLEFPPLEGQAFCFLPLPVRTQLPVHINAYFELSSNRRDIWRGDDTTGESKVRGQWNDLLLRDVLAPLYGMLLSRVVHYVIQHKRNTPEHEVATIEVGNALRFSSCDDSSKYEEYIEQVTRKRREFSATLGLLPSPPPPEPWSILSTALLPLLINTEILWSNINGGTFLPLGKAVIMKDYGLSTASANSSKVASNGRSESMSSSAVAIYRLEHLLILENLPIAVIPDEAFQTLAGGSVAVVAGQVSPSFVRNHFRVLTTMDNHSLSSRGKACAEYLQHHPALSVDSATIAITSNAAFLLDICISDIHPNDTSVINSSKINNVGGATVSPPLCGLQLVPMEDGTLGLIGDATDAAPLFLASENERRLLQKVGQCIIANDTVLGTRVAEYFRQPHFSDTYNIRSLSALDTLKLLKEIVPDDWFSSSTVLVNRFKGSGRTEEESDVYVSVQWLQGLWGYILESESLSLFEGMIPMLPVYQPPFHKDGSYLLKLFPSIPVLHLSFKELIDDPEAVAALGDLGLHIFDPSDLGAIAYSKELAGILCDPSPAGLLQALCAVSGNIADASLSWSRERRNSMRHLVLDLILAKVEKVSEDAREVLRSLPIYLRCKRGLKSSVEAHCALRTVRTDGDDINPASFQFSLQIPPRSVKEDIFFDENFVSLRTSKDRDLYTMLGLSEPTGGSFYLSSVLPNVAKGLYIEEAMDQLSVNLLVSLSVLEKQQPGLSEMLKSCAFVKNAAGQYCRPSELYDPHAPYLPSLMPVDAFPCSLLYEKSDMGTILTSLRKIGLCSSLTRASVLRAAEAIERDREVNKLTVQEQQLAAEGRGDDVLDNSVSAGPMSINEKHANVQRAVQRSVNLMRYLDLNIQELLLTADDTESTVIEAIGEKKECREDWCRQLRDLSWIAVHVRVPSVCFINSIAPPWPESLHLIPLAKASQCALSRHIWLCSTSCRIPQVDLHSEELKEVLGWAENSIPGRFAAQQLIAVWQYFQSSAKSVKSPSGSSLRKKEEKQHQQVVDMCSSIVPRLMAALSDALETESEVDVDIWCRALKSKPIIWVASASTFIEPNRIAFSALSGINAEPSLYVATGELLVCRTLLLRLGAKESFDLNDLCGLLREQKSIHLDNPLTKDNLDMCVGIIKIIVQLLDPAPVNVDGDKDSVDCTMDDLTVETKTISEDDFKAKAEQLRLAKASMGEVYIPDRNAVLVKSQVLTYDDAPWISSQLGARGGGGGLHFVHDFIESATAALLGAKSLREQLFAGDDIVCPTAASVSEILSNDSVTDALADLVGLSDMVGAAATHLLYDGRSHPCESLMHPGLAECQGRALVVFIEGVVLESEKIAQLLMSPALLYQLPTAFGTGVALPLNTTSATDEDEISRKEIKYNTYGKRLNAAFAISDCVQILSGHQYMIFDPCGTHLLSNSVAVDDVRKEKDASNTKRALAPKAQRCSLVGQNNEDLLSRFPDQFSPMLNLSFSVEGGLTTANSHSTSHLVRAGQVNGTIIRMPLRYSPSALSSNFFVEDQLSEVMPNLLRDCIGWLEGSLLFSRFVQVVTLQHWHRAIDHVSTLDMGNDDDCLVKEFYFMRCTNASAIQAARKKVVIDKSWKKAGRSSVSNLLTSLFTQGINPVAEVSLTAHVIHRCGILTDSAVPVSRIVSPADHSWLRFQEKACLDDDGNEKNEMLSSWLLTCLQGAPKSRNLALKAPYKSLGILPYVSIAAKVMSFEDIDACFKDPMRKLQRYVFCGAGAVHGAAAGLPFHLDGSFVMDMSARGVIGMPAELDYRQVTTPSSVTQVMSLELRQQWNSSLLSACLDTLVPSMLLQMRDRIVAANEGGLSNDLKRFYIYWPFLSSMSSDLAFVALHQSTIFTQLSQEAFYLGRRQFENLSSVVIPLTPNPPCVNEYLQSFMPFADVPSQVAKDFTKAKIRIQVLTPEKLRTELQVDSHVHCSRLRGRHEVVSAMLKYCLSDLTMGGADSVGASQSEYQQRRSFAMLKGCPLLIMADGQTACFPKDGFVGFGRSEPVYVAPLTLHIILNPSIRGALLHPTALSDVSGVFDNPIFKDTLNIKDVSTLFIRDNASYFLPQTWVGCTAVEWTPTNNANRGIRSSGLSLQSDTHGPSSLLIYSLWREVLSSASIDDLLMLSTLPLLPVVVGTGVERIQLLVSTSFASSLLNTANALTAAQEESRMHCSRECGRLKSLIVRDGEAIISKISSLYEYDSMEKYAECENNASGPETKKDMIVDNTDDVETSASFSLPTTSLPPSITQEEDGIDSNSAVNVPTGTLPTVINNSVPLDVFSSLELEQVLQVLRFPQLDGSLLEGPPQAIQESAERSRFQNGGASSLGHKILNCLSLIHTMKVTIYQTSDSSSALLEYESLLAFEKLNVAQRKTLLLEFLNAHRSRAFSPPEVNSLKGLPLFTNREGGILAPLQGPDVYWCESDTALAGLESTYDTFEDNGTNLNAMPVVLINDPDLRDIYQLIGAEELTPGLVVRKFTLASLGRMQGAARVRIMRSLSEQWSNYSDDAELVELLKRVPFIPAWAMSSTDGTGVEVILDTAPHRSPDTMFSWKNDALLEALQGPDVAEYFVPPSMRSNQWHDMLTDLGMQSDLDKTSTIRVAKDIEAAADSMEDVGDGKDKKMDGCDSFPVCVQSPAQRGRALLRYLRDDDRVFLFDSALCRALKSIRFVPAQVPLRVESAGFMVFKQTAVCRFEQLMSAQKGHLGFTILPILDSDISPPQTCFSSLGVTVTPPMQEVLRHLKNIIASAGDSGDTLDRWNMEGKFTLRDTFQELFGFLADHWRDINPVEQLALSASACVPVGHALIKPGRLFFRLSEDLSPFMHEIPRFFGVHEVFLKSLGVRERPSSEDYAHFLSELAVECRGVSLNPNELRAVLAIVNAIAQEKETEINVGSDTKKNLMTTVFVPDENSILRNSAVCLFNNNGWLRERLPNEISKAEHALHILHPFVTRDTASFLLIPPLSEVLVEQLPPGFDVNLSRTHDLYSDIFLPVIKSESFALAISQLFLRGTGICQQEVSTEDIIDKLQKVELCFVKTVKTVMEIRDPRLQDSRHAKIVTDATESLCFVASNSDNSATKLIVNSGLLVPPDALSAAVVSSSDFISPLHPSVALGVGLARAFLMDPPLAATLALLLSEASTTSAGTQTLLSHLRISSDSASLRERLRGSPGSFVNSSDKLMLELKPFRAYRPGEIIAFESASEDRLDNNNLSDGGMVYGRVLVVEGDDNDGLVTTSSDVFRDGIGESLGLKRITVRINAAGETATFLPTSLYSFKSARDVSLHTPERAPVVSTTAKEITNNITSDVASVSSISQPANISSTLHAQGKDSSSSVKSEAVSQDEIIEALGGLLHRAGIPMTLEKEHMITRILELEASNGKAVNTLATERLAFAESQDTIDNMKAAIRCQICLSSNISHVLVPCGHTMCGDCLVQLQRNKCPFCRTNIEKRTKFYFSSDDADGS